MAQTPIYPKKNPGYANVRTGSAVNTGVINNLLVKINYGQEIGRLTGLAKNASFQGKNYIWFEVVTSKGKGLIREDAFSYAKVNAESQADPIKDRAAVAAANLKRAVAKLQAVGAKLNVVGKNNGKLTTAQAKRMQQVRTDYISSLKKLQATGAVQLNVKGALAGVTGLGFVWTIPLILGAGVIVSTFSAFVIDRALKWFAQIHQVESEADQQLTVIATLEKAAQSTDPATSQEAVKALDEMAKRSEETQSKVVDSQEKTDLVSNVKQVVIWGGAAFLLLELYKASNSKR